MRFRTRGECEIMKKDYSVSLIRLLATVMIIVCHLFQYFDNDLHRWFDVGVQIFFCMSGYLYGKRMDGKEDEILFYKKRFIKILTDYYVTILIAMAVEAVFVPASLTKHSVIGSLILYSELDGGGHLWYIPYILLCYLVTPLLIRYFSHLKKDGILFAGMAAVFIVNNMINYTFANYFNPAWINCFIVGLFCGFCEKNSRGTVLKITKSCIFAAAAVLNAIQIYVEYFTELQLEDVFLFYEVKTNAHAALGLALFFAGQWLFGKCRFGGFTKVLDWTDRFTYDVYLTHHFFIIGPLSLMELTPYLPLNIVIILAGVFLSSLLVYFVSGRIKKKLKVF